MTQHDPWETLLTITEPDLRPGTPAVDPAHFDTRSAARAVLFDRTGAVYLMHVGLHGYHKLPGGGIDEGESIEAAMRRELLEEVGCEAEIAAELGAVVEYRDYTKLKQTSYCYLARQVGKQRPAALEAGEIAEGMSEVKAADIDAAIVLLEEDQPDNLEGKFIQQRDLCFLKTAQALLSL